MRNLSISDNTALVVVSWAEPSELNGNISYMRNIECVRLLDGSAFFSSTVTVAASDRMVTVPREAYSECTVTITPQTGAGMGPNSTEMLRIGQEGEKLVERNQDYVKYSYSCLVNSCVSISKIQNISRSSTTC